MGIIFDIQAYAIYDGPGIRTCVYFKGCPLRCDWCHNPESQALQPEMGYWKEKCKLCGSCVEDCSEGALRISEDEIIRDRSLCIVCGNCAETCMNGAMEKIGFETDVDDIVKPVLCDREFFKNSGGGVTMTGGEPTFQKDFLLELLSAFKKAGVHTAIETCGFFSENLLDDLLNNVDLFLFDIKHSDPDRHRECTGVGNEKILANFSEILRRAGSERIIPRMPLIPGFNTDEKCIDGWISFLKQKNYCGTAHLMPYHNWSKGKYSRLGRADSFRDSGKISEAELNKICGVFNDAGFPTVCYG